MDGWMFFLSISIYLISHIYISISIYIGEIEDREIDNKKNIHAYDNSFLYFDLSFSFSFVMIYITQINKDNLLNLNILLSSGKESNDDFLSNGE